MSGRAIAGRDAAAAVLQAFRGRFAAEPAALVRAPGRVNLIGEHTDYNEGFVLPLAIDKEVWIALRPAADRSVRVWANDLGRWGEFDLDDYARGEGWLEYLKGVAWALGEQGNALRPWEGVLGGDLPRGAGLSSSAALELAAARAFYEVSGFAWDPVAMARCGMRAENGWVGANTGIMDQLIAATGLPGHAMLIDCRSLDLTPVALPQGVSVVVLDTMTRHSHTDSGYNDRRTECERAARHFGVSALRDLSHERLESDRAGLEPALYRRARHVVSENARTEAVAAALREPRDADLHAIGALLNASHASLRDDFEVTNGALDTMVACALAQGECLGARMTGGGFGGSVVALVLGPAERFMAEVAKDYAALTGSAPTTTVVSAGAGASSAFGLR